MASRQLISRSNTTSSTVRRNLFSQSHARRPAANATTEAFQHAEDTDNSILIRDADGKCQLTRPKPDDDEDEVVQEALAKNDRKFIELYRSENRQNTDLNELRSAVQASLQAKVASLDEDKWMYEREDDVDPQA